MTLATLYIFRALDVIIVGGGMVVASTLPNGFFAIPTASWSELSAVPYLAIVIAVVVGMTAYCCEFSVQGESCTI